MPATKNLFPYHKLKLQDKPEIAYIDAGPKTAPAILFLHGLGDSSQIWNQPITDLQQNFRCLALDLPGHGISGSEHFNFQMHAYADLIEAFLKALKLTSVTLAGHSMGGQISIIVALRLPALIEKLILVAPAGFEQFTEAEKKMLQFGASYSNTWAATGTNSSAEKAALRQHALQQSLKGMLAEPIFDFLPHLNMPVLVIFGEQDAFIPNRYLHPQSTAVIARAGATQIPNAELHLFARCGHYPQAEQPQLFNKTLQFFLKKQAAYK